MVSRSLVVLLLSPSLLLATLGACTTTTVIQSTDDGGVAPIATGDSEPEPSDAAADAVAKADANDGLCHPRSTSGYSSASAPYEPPYPSGHGTCTDRQIDAFFECVLGNTASCQELTDGGGTSACKQCIEVSRTVPGYWGPLPGLVPQGSPVPNSAGCGALINGDTTTSGCGKALAAHEGCLDYTCLAQCPKDYAACAQESGTGVCKPFMDAAKAACPIDVRECYVQKADTSGNDLRKRVVRRFCGPL